MLASNSPHAYTMASISVNGWWFCWKAVAIEEAKGNRIGKVSQKSRCLILKWCQASSHKKCDIHDCVVVWCFEIGSYGMIKEKAKNLQMNWIEPRKCGLVPKLVWHKKFHRQFSSARDTALRKIDVYKDIYRWIINSNQ